MDAPPAIVFKMPTAPAKAAPKAAPVDFLGEARRVIEQNEGRKNQLYKDSKDLWTVGVGHLVAPKDLKKYQGKTLTDAEVSELFEKDLERRLKAARSKLGDDVFEGLPTVAKVAVADGFFRGDLSGSPKALTLIREGKLAEAADEYLNHKEYKDSVASNKAGKRHGVARRMEQNAQRLREAAALERHRKLSTETAAPLPLSNESPFGIRFP